MEIHVLYFPCKNYLLVNAFAYTVNVIFTTRKLATHIFAPSLKCERPLDMITTTTSTRVRLLQLVRPNS